jgi:hypothetical protein
MLQNSILPFRHVLQALLLICLMLLCAGCAASSTTIIEEEVVTNPKPMYRYTSLLIRDLELKRELYTDASDAGMSDRDHRYAQLPEELSGHIERAVRSRGIYTAVLRDGKPDGSTLLLTGRFIRLGRFKITVLVRLRDGESGQEVASFRQTLWDVLDTTDSFSDLGREVASFLYRIQYK